MAITLDFNAKHGSVVKTTSIIQKEPKRESSVLSEKKFEKSESLKNLQKSESTRNVKEASESTRKIESLAEFGGKEIEKSAQTPQETSFLTFNNPSDLPFIDEDDRELDEAIQVATGLEKNQMVTSIQLGSTSSYSTASTLLVSQRSCSGTDTIHMSEKVIKRDYRDL